MRRIRMLLVVSLAAWSSDLLAYSATANVTVNFGGNGGGPAPPILAQVGIPPTLSADVTWTSNGASNSLFVMSNSVYFSNQGGYNGLNYYNSDFATPELCNQLVGPAATVRKYGCRWSSSGGNVYFMRSPITDDGPVGRAVGTLHVTDTTLTGTLQLVSSTDEPTGAILSTTTPYGAHISNTVGAGTNAYNFRAADGSPFGNYWQGLTTAGTYELSLTGTFTPTSWNITGGTARFNDPGLLCQQGGVGALFDGQAGVLCTSFGYPGVYQHNGAHLSWGWDLDGNGSSTTISQIDVRDDSGSILIASLSGVLASLTIDGAGNISTIAGEFRRANDPTSGGCGGMLRWNGTRISCGALTVGKLDISGSIATPVPLPAAAWMLGGALLALRGLQRRRSTSRAA